MWSIKNILLDRNIPIKILIFSKVCIILKISPPPLRSKKSCSTDDDSYYNYKLYYLEMHGLLSFGKIRTGSCKIVYIASYRSRARFERRRPIYSIVSDHCRANPNFSELSIPRISSTPLLLLSATPIILLLSLLTLYLRDSPVSLFYFLIFSFFLFRFFFLFFRTLFFE